MDNRVGKALAWFGMAAMALGMFTASWFIGGDDSFELGWGLIFGHRCNESGLHCGYQKLAANLSTKGGFDELGVVTLAVGLVCIGLMAVLLVARRPRRGVARAGVVVSALAGPLAVAFMVSAPFGLRARLHGHMGYSFPVFLLGALAMFLAYVILMPPKVLVGETESVPDLSP